ncbi:hypothetical protein L289_0793 [Acinetobacter gerneri DSM 14967 = CIP 107464 = MTCC 9824]|nr:hypothetical protein L289_0793 [Acinetobacter gerneri DSM 14967 = CIP 107464 = MTCC 9824]
MYDRACVVAAKIQSLVQHYIDEQNRNFYLIHEKLYCDVG